MSDSVGNNQSSALVLFENFITITDLSLWLKVPQKTIRDWVYKRQIPFQKIGKHVRFVPSAIRTWIERSKYGD